MEPLSSALIGLYTVPWGVANMVAKSSIAKMAMIALLLVIGNTYLAVHTGLGCGRNGAHNIELFFGPTGANSGVLTSLKLRNSTGHWNERTLADRAEDTVYYVAIDPHNPVSCLHNYDAGRELVKGLAIFMAVLFGLGGALSTYTGFKNKSTMYASVSIVTTIMYTFVTVAMSIGIWYTIDALHHADPAEIDHKSGRTMLMMIAVVSSILAAVYFLTWLGSTFSCIMDALGMKRTQLYQYITNYTLLVQGTLPNALVGNNSPVPKGQPKDAATGVHCLAVNAHVRDESLALFGVFIAVAIMAFLAHGFVDHNVEGHPIKHAYVQGQAEYIWVNGTVNVAYEGSGSPGAALSSFTAGQEARVEYTGPATAMWELKHYFKWAGTTTGVFMIVLVICACVNAGLSLWVWSKKELTPHEDKPVDGIQAMSEIKWVRVMLTIAAAHLALLPLAFLTDTLTMFQMDLSGQDGETAPKNVHVTFSVVAVLSLVAFTVLFALLSIEIGSPLRAVLKAKPEKTLKDVS
jgi:hypothetical protein